MSFKDKITKLQNLSETKKKVILWVIVAILGLVMGYFWVRGALDTVSNLGNIVK